MSKYRGWNLLGSEGSDSMDSTWWVDHRKVCKQ